MTAPFTMSGSHNKGPLTNLKVLDLSRVLAGPWSTQMLGDLGADVIKIERPHSGDDTRHWGPPFITNADGTQGDAAYFMSANRSKESRAIDITTPQGQEQIRALAQECDILVENYKVGGLKKYGLDYDSLKAINLRLIYCSITGFGQEGPYAHRAGYDFMIQGMSGLMSITGEHHSIAGTSPQKVGVAISDLVTGMYATVGILSALHHRHMTGQGQYIDLALLDCQLSMLANQNSNYLIGGQAPQRMGNAHPNIVPYQTFETADSHIILAIGNDHQFAKFCDLIDQPQWCEADYYQRNAQRVEKRETLISDLIPIIRLKPNDYWLTECEARHIPCSPINTIEQAFNNPQIKHRQMLHMMSRDDGTQIPTVANPLKFSETPLDYQRPPPKLEE